MDVSLLKITRNQLQSTALPTELSKARNRPLLRHVYLYIIQTVCYRSVKEKGTTLLRQGKNPPSSRI